MDAFRVLEAIDDNELFRALSLPDIGNSFYIPTLQDKPQNPIVQNLNKGHGLGGQQEKRVFFPRLVQNLPKELVVLSERIVAMRGNDWLELEGDKEEENLWQRAAKETQDQQSEIVSWDTLRSSYKHANSPSPFLTEQEAHIVNATRHHVNPRMFDPNREPVYVSTDDILEDLKSTLVACSSTYHIWNQDLERFIPSGSTSDLEKVVVIVGMDEVISNSYIARFTTIGTLLRRLEILAASYRTIISSNNPTSYAFGHALISVAVSLRERILYTIQADIRPSSARLSELWLALAELEDTLHSLASMCRREISTSPPTYTSLPSSTPAILSHIHDHLSRSIQHSSPPLLTALIAYILTTTSRPLFRDVCQSVGFHGLGQSSSDRRQRARKERLEVAAGIFSDGDEEGGASEEDEDDDNGEKSAEKIRTAFPAFMDQSVVDAIIGARRSLKILFTYELDHGTTKTLPELPLVEWVWTEDELCSLLLSAGTKRNAGIVSVATQEANAIYSDRYRPELASFAKFDLPPASTSTRSSTPTCSSFLKSFPLTLPPPTPTLPFLTSTVLSPFLAQFTHLSKYALELFMTPTTQLHFRAHLLLLRGYLLLGADPFRRRLEGALFADSDGDEDEEVRMGIMSEGARALGLRKQSGGGLETQGPWAVGLAHSLTDRMSWPPGGTDLALLLRRVIVDSLEGVRQSDFVKAKVPVVRPNAKPSVGPDSDENRKVQDEVGCDGDLGSEVFWEDVEARLGFTTQDLPNTGREKWLDPTSIESLDFLFMIYKPPRPLDSLITHEILSKYRRVFNFLMRLMRVENALKVAFRLTRPSTSPLFPISSQAHKILLFTRFKMDTFVTALSSYIYTAAIGNNIDALVARLVVAERSPESGYTLPHVFSDVFGLMKHHSAVMDDIMAACMLRSGQRKLKELLMSCLECVLAFTVLVGELKRNRVGSVDVERRMKRLSEKFGERVKALVKSLRASSHAEDGVVPVPVSHPSTWGDWRSHHTASGGIEALGDLALRLDVNNWWKNSNERS